MYSVLLLIHALLAGAIVIIVLVQRSDSDGFGMGSGGGAGGGVLSSKAKATFLTRSTAVLATSFMTTSLALAVISVGENNSSVLDGAPAAAITGTEPETDAPPTDLGDLPDAASEADDASPALPFAD